MLRFLHFSIPCGLLDGTKGNVGSLRSLPYAKILFQVLCGRALALLGPSPVPVAPQSPPETDSPHRVPRFVIPGGVSPLINTGLNVVNWPTLLLLEFQEFGL